jgi:hypothetical protein
MCWLGGMHVYETGVYPELFTVGTDPLAMYNLFDFKNYVIKIMSSINVM